MKIQQLSIFAENKPGHLAGPCRLLAEQGVDVRALSVADTIERVVGIRMKTTLVEPQTIQRSEGKAKRVIDKRGQS